MKKHFLISILIPCSLLYSSDSHKGLGATAVVPSNLTATQIRTQAALVKLQYNENKEISGVVRQHNPYASVVMSNSDITSDFVYTYCRPSQVSSSQPIIKRVVRDGRPRLEYSYVGSYESEQACWISSHEKLSEAEVPSQFFTWSNVGVYRCDNVSDTSSIGTSLSTPNTPTMTVAISSASSNTSSETSSAVYIAYKTNNVLCLPYHGRRVPITKLVLLAQELRKEKQPENFVVRRKKSKKRTYFSKE